MASGAKRTLGALALLAAPTLVQAAPLAPHQLWVGHGLAALVVALVGFVLARWWALAGIALVAAFWYAFSQIAGAGAAAEGLQAFGARYPFHVQATALLVPLALAAGVMGWRNLQRR